MTSTAWMEQELTKRDGLTCYRIFDLSNGYWPFLSEKISQAISFLIHRMVFLNEDQDNRLFSMVLILLYYDYSTVLLIVTVCLDC